MKLSVVVPAYNESEGIEEFHYNHLIKPIEKAAKNNYEIIYVNDGSRDNTLKILTGIAQKNARVKVVNLSRNFGKEVAISAGISQSCGDATITLDADGQHPPLLIPDFIKKWQSGAQVVVGVRKSSQEERIIKKWGSKAFYKLLNSSGDARMVPGSTDFRLIDKDVRAEFIRLSEHNRIARGLIDWLGFNRDYIYFDSPNRLAGQASYTINKLVKLALNSITSLSLKPLFMFGWIGLGIIIVSTISGLFILVEQYGLGDPMQMHFSGSAILSIFIAFLVGLILISQAITAIYISQIYIQSKNRPLFIIDRKNSTNIN